MLFLRPRFSGAAILFSVIVVLLPSLSVAADPSRAYSAMYQVSEVKDNGDPVLLRFSFQLVNHTAVDVTYATLVLREVPGQSGGYATFTGVDIPSGRHVEMSQQISVPRMEYRRWQHGAPPLAFLQSQGVERPVEMGRRSILMGGK